MHMYETINSALVGAIRCHSYAMPLVLLEIVGVQRLHAYMAHTFVEPITRSRVTASFSL